MCNILKLMTPCNLLLIKLGVAVKEGKEEDEWLNKSVHE